MKYFGEIKDKKDLTTKEYVDAKVGSSIVVSTTPPSDIGKIWINNGVPYYFDPNENAWLSMKFITDINKISVD